MAMIEWRFRRHLAALGARTAGLAAAMSIGNFLGSPVMYQMSGKSYVLVAAANSAGFRGFGAGAAAAPQTLPAAPMGWDCLRAPREIAHQRGRGTLQSIIERHV